MDDVRTLAGLEHKLKRRLAEKREPVVVVVAAVELPAVEEAVL
jgi:hypothetical protein